MKFLRPREAAKRVGFHHKHLPRIPDFPKKIVLGPRSVGYLESEIEAWMQARVAERDQADAAEADEDPAPPANPAR